MSKPQFAILRFAKYKGPEISNIEAHNERTKEKYASNPDIDKSRSHLNFHLITPEQKYRAEAERQIKEVGCRTRSDSVRVVEALVTATPEFFKGKKKNEIKAYFQEALDFIREHQDPKTIISAVVHMDEKTPPYAPFFCPADRGRTAQRQGNRRQQEEADAVAGQVLGAHGQKISRSGARRKRQRNWTRPYPAAAVQGGRAPEPNEGADHGDSERHQSVQQKVKLDELEALLGKYVPGAEALRTKLKKYDAAYKTLTAENAALEKQLGAASKESVLKKLEINEKLRELDELHRMVDGIPPEILQAAKQVSAHKQQER